jgi:hypothetical protein
MSRRVPLACWFPCLVLACLAMGPADAVEYDYLEFEINYKGKMSSNKVMPVAKAVWSSPVMGSSGVDALSLMISSEKHMKLEMSLPMRICHQSHFNQAQKRSQDFESYMQAGKRLDYLRVAFDWSGRTMRYESSKAEMDSANTDPYDLTGRAANKKRIDWKTESGQVSLKKVLLDRLSMLQQLRGMNLREGQVISVPVSDGKRPMEYWVTVTEDDSLSLMGQNLQALKLNFETFDLDPEHDRPMHPPVDVWISKDARRLPLRMVGKFPVGLLDAKLVRIGKSRESNLQCKGWPGFSR